YALTTPAAGQPLLVAGQGQAADLRSAAFVWDSQTREMRDLNLLVVNPPQQRMWEARGINVNGLIIANVDMAYPALSTLRSRRFLLPPNATLPAATAPPADPSALNATAISATQVSLTWMNNASDANGYAIDRMQNGQDWVQIAALPPDATTYTDSLVINQGM